MAGRKSVKRGIRKSRKGLRKRNGKKTYKRSIKKEGGAGSRNTDSEYDVSEYEYDLSKYDPKIAELNCRIIDIIKDSPPGENEYLSVFSFVRKYGARIYSKHGETKQMLIYCDKLDETLLLQVEMIQGRRQTDYILYCSFSGENRKPLLQLRIFNKIE
jgi:hypothetical protein